MSLDDLKAFFRSMSMKQAKEHLDKYTVEEVRRMWENGAFGKGPISKGIKSYIIKRILAGDRIE